MIYKALQPLLIVESRGSWWRLFRNTGFTELSANSFRHQFSECTPHQAHTQAALYAVLVGTGLFRCRFNSAFTLAAVVRCFLSTMCFNARRSLLVNFEVRPILLWLLERFFELLKFRHSPWHGSSRKTKQFSCFGDWGSCHRSSNNLNFFKLS